MPLLSICIPTYNGAKYLPIVLQAMVPQVVQAGDRVEVVFVDDCSTDDIESVIARADLPPQFRFVRNATNVGMARNIANAISVHARGEYVWVMSQHNLLAPAGLASVIDSLEANSHLDAFYVNFRCATYPARWPTSAEAGYDGPFDYLCRTDVQSRELARWEELLQAKTSVCTQTYSHIVRREMVKSTLAGQNITRDFDTAIDAYTQTWAVANSMFGRPAYYIGTPVMTIYDGAQTWSSLRDQAKVWLQAYPDLLRIYRRLGWKGPELKSAEQIGNRHAASIMQKLIADWKPDEGRIAIRYFVRNWRSAGTPSALVRSFFPGAVK